MIRRWYTNNLKENNGGRPELSTRMATRFLAKLGEISVHIFFPIRLTRLDCDPVVDRSLPTPLAPVTQIAYPHNSWNHDRINSVFRGELQLVIVVSWQQQILEDSV